MRLLPRILLSLALLAGAGEAAIQSIHTCWNAGNKDHTLHKLPAWSGETCDGEAAFLADDMPAIGTVPILGCWSDVHQEHTFHQAPAWSGESCSKTAFYAYTDDAKGRVALFSCWNKANKDHHFHGLPALPGESCGDEPAFYALAAPTPAPPVPQCEPSGQLQPTHSWEGRASASGLTRGEWQISYDLNSGLIEVGFKGQKILERAYSAAEVEGCGTILSTASAFSRARTDSEGSDVLGKYSRISVLHSGFSKNFAIEQVFYLYHGKPTLHVELLVHASGAWSIVGSKRLVPVIMRHQLGPALTGRQLGLVAPYDNDMHVRWRVLELPAAVTGAWATAIYDEGRGNGTVAGSLDHSIWKSGVEFNETGHVHLVSGLADEALTHDVLPHGVVLGDTVRSARWSVSVHSDWRAGLEDYAQEVATFTPRLSWLGGEPEPIFGWNSWGALQADLNLSTAIAAAEAIADLKPAFSEKSVQYIGLDSYWDNLSEEDLALFVEVCRKNGQRTGIYYAPWVFWGDNVDGEANCHGDKSFELPGRPSWREMMLRDSAGEPLPKMDGAYALDPTHMAVQQCAAAVLRRFRSLGFELVKIDFLSHGSLEAGQHADVSVTTGQAAYYNGMRFLAQVASEDVSSPLRLAYSIAPLFPHQFAHSRRIACDQMYGEVAYTLNALTYGWWLSALYQLDPDLVTLNVNKSEEGGKGLSDARSRVAKGVVHGGLLLNGDDLTDPRSSELASRYFSADGPLLALHAGRAFRPWAFGADSDDGAAAVFTLLDATPGRHFVAAFNYGSQGEAIELDLRRMGLELPLPQTVTDLWEGNTRPVPSSGILSLAVPAFSSAFVMLEYDSNSSIARWV